MRLVVMGIVLLMIAGVAAGYYGIADEIADGFKLLALVSIVSVLAGTFFGGVRVSDARPDRHLPPRIRAVI